MNGKKTQFIHKRKANFIRALHKCNVCIAQAAWLRCLNGAAFASLKKIFFGFFFNHAFGMTEPLPA